MKLHHVEGYIQSIYLVEYKDKLLLLDGCSRADIPMLKTFVEDELKRKISDIALIIVTHMHPDHAGGAHRLRAITGCKIAAANVKGNWYSGFDGLLMHLTDIMLAHYVAKRMGKPKRRLWYKSKLAPDYRLNHGDDIPGFDDWQAFFTQGHTDRDLSIFHKPSQKVYVADLMVNVKGKYISPFPVFYPRRYLDSIQFIRSLNPKAIWLAHSGEIKTNDIDFEHLINTAPKAPATHWRSVKTKFLRAIKK